MHHTRNAVAMLEALFPIPEIQGAIFRYTLPYPRKQIVAPLVHRYDVTCCCLTLTHTCTCADISAIERNQPYAHIKMVNLRESKEEREYSAHLSDIFLVRLIRVISKKVHSEAVTIS